MKGGSRSISSSYSPKISGVRGASGDDCSIVFEVLLESLHADITKCAKGDVLPVAHIAANRLAAMKDSIPMGLITSPEALQVIECIRKGIKYKATILDINKSMCKVKIQRLLK